MAVLNRKCLGVFNNLLIPWAKSRFASVSLVTWNGRAILHHKPRLRDRKRDIIDDLSVNGSVLAFQELHGSKEKLDLIYPRLHKQFYVFASFSERLDPHGQTKQDEAGVALAFAKCGTSSSEGFVPQVFVPGRVLRVSVAVGDCESIYWCIHNFGVSAAQMDSIEIAFRAEAAENPRAVTVFAMGDVNYVCEGEYQRSLELPNDTRLGSHSLSLLRALGNPDGNTSSKTSLSSRSHLTRTTAMLTVFVQESIASIPPSLLGWLSSST